MKRLSAAIGISIVICGLLYAGLWYTGNPLSNIQTAAVFVAVIITALSGGR